MGHRDPHAIDRLLDRHCHVDVVEQDEPVLPFPMRVHHLVLVDRTSQAGDEERGERERLARPSALLADGTASVRDVELEKTMHRVTARRNVEPVADLAHGHGQRDDSVTGGGAGHRRHDTASGRWWVAASARILMPSSIPASM